MTLFYAIINHFLKRKRMKSILKLIFVLGTGASIALLNGCTGAQTGAATGAVAGSVIGYNTKGHNKGQRAAVGGLLGAAVGGGIGHAVDSNNPPPQQTGGWQ